MAEWDSYFQNSSKNPDKVFEILRHVPNVAGSEAVLDNEHNAVFDESSLKRTGEHESTDGSQNKHRKHSSDKTQLKEHDSSSSQAAVNKTDSEKETAVELPNSLIADHKTNDQASMKEVFPQFGGVGEIKDFLKGHSMETVQGHTCYVTSCPKLGKMVMKKKHKSEGERLFINITSGTVFMPPTLKKLIRHIGSGLYVHLSICQERCMLGF